MWIDFEGIDGSGKTTVSTRVAQELRRRGREVVHAREGGTFASPIAGRVRELVRSTECLLLAPQAEFLLNLAREAQLVSEVVRPALARGAWVITDRTVYSHVGLARNVRGLDAPGIEAAASVAVQGLRPDRVFYVDVDPDVARWRKRLRKIRDRRMNDSGRKGQLGDALARKSRRAFLDLSAAGGSWCVVDNTWRPIDETIADVLALLDGRPRPPAPRGPFEADPDRLLDGYFDFASSLRDRSLAALLAAGIDDPRADAIRRAAPPDEAAYAVSGMDAPAAWALREELRGDAPYYVARSLAGLGPDARAWALRRELEPVVPDQVLLSLGGDGGAEAHSLRQRHWEDHPDESIRSVKGLADAPSWELRLRARRERPSPALAESLAGLDTDLAWEMRREFEERHPLAVLRGVRGVNDARAWALRSALASVAPKAVLGTLEGVEGPEAEALRDRLKGTAPEETAASLAKLDTPAAWRLREELRDEAPAGVLKSLRGVGRSRAEAFASGVVRRHPRRLRVAREAVQFRARVAWTNTSI